MDLITGFGIFLSGFSVVFIALAMVVASTWLLVNVIIPWSESIWPEVEPKSKKSASQQQPTGEIPGEMMAVITRAVLEATDGRGVPVTVRRN